MSIPPLDTDKTSAGRSGAVTLVRHGEPALSRRIKLDAAGYREWWARYEEGGLLPGQAPTEHVRSLASAAGHIFSSTRRRAIETARMVSGDRLVPTDVLLIEAPLPPPRWPSFVRFSPRTWGFIARVWWWYLNHHEGEESRQEAEARADRVATNLIGLAAEGQDVLIVAHGFFNTLIGRALKKKGWRCAHDQGFKYWSARRFERI